MPRLLNPDQGSGQRRAAAYRQLDEKRPLFDQQTFEAIARAARLPFNVAFTRHIQSAVITYLSWRALKPDWTPSAVKHHLRSVSSAAERLEELLRKLPEGARLVVEQGARDIQRSDIERGFLHRTEGSDGVPKYSVITSSARVNDCEMDVTGILLNPTAPYPIEILRRASTVAAESELVSAKVRPLAITVDNLSRWLDLPLTASVSFGPLRSGKAGFATGGRLVRLVVALMDAVSRLDLPAFGLPDRSVRVGADAVKKVLRSVAARDQNS